MNSNKNSVRFLQAAKIFLLFAAVFQMNFAFAQEPDPMDTGKALLQNAYHRGVNIELGVGAQSFLISDTKASFGDKLNLIPNTYEYYVSSPAIMKMESSGNLMSVGFRVGKRMYRDTPELSDSVSIFNCSEIDFYFLGASMQYPMMKVINKNMYWSWNPGLYLDFLIGNMEPEIKNGTLEADMVIVSHANEPQNLKPLDWGLALNFEFGFRAAYTGVSLRTGLRNLAPDKENMTIRNNGMINYYIGYRFESKIGKADKEKVDKLVPR